MRQRRVGRDFLLPINNGSTDAKCWLERGALPERGFGEQGPGREQRDEQGEEKQESHRFSPSRRCALWRLQDRQSGGRAYRGQTHKYFKVDAGDCRLLVMASVSSTTATFLECGGKRSATPLFFCEKAGAREKRRRHFAVPPQSKKSRQKDVLKGFARSSCH